VHRESENGVEAYPVYVHRRSGEVRRPWTGFSGEAKSDSLLGELHRGTHNLSWGSDGVGKVSTGRSTVVGDRVAAGTPLAGQPPVISGSGEVESTRGSTIDVPGGFIGAGSGSGAGLAWRDAGARGGACRACSGELRARRTRVCLLLPSFNGRLEHFSVKILAKPLYTISSLHHILPFLCVSQAKIRSG
jgi:hypothetical protein